MRQCYKIDSRKISFREYWNITRSPNVIIAWIAKILRIPMDFGSSFEDPGKCRDLEVAEEALPPASRERLAPHVSACQQQGFHSPRYYLFRNLRRTTETSIAALCHSSETAIVRVMHCVASGGPKQIQNLMVVILSELSDGTYFVSSNERERFRPMPGTIVNRHVGATAAELWQSHQDALASMHMRNPPKLIRTCAEADDLSDRYERAGLEYGIKVGRYVPIEGKEAEQATQHTQAIDAMAAAGVENAPVLGELKRLQESRAGWGNAIMLFIISALMFVGAGARQWSWSFVLLLVPILLFHELGHYVAMRAFNYRNLRMFFIPFFGAAVSGRNHNVPGWKKVVVSLMGPLPGIILGIVLGALGLILHQPMLMKAAMLALILNAINLLPILPLDGGWIFHTLLFSRHHILDAAFRVIAVIALVLWGMQSKDKIMMYLAIPMAMGIPTAYRMARIATKLRKSGLPPMLPEEQAIPTATAQVIIAEVKQALPAQQSTKTLAQQTLHVFETLNARPPGWFATAGLLIVQLGAVLMAGLFVVIFIIGNGGDLTRLARLAGTRNHPLACDAVKQQGPTALSTSGARAHDTVVATFSSPKAAQRAYEAEVQQNTAKVVLFGQSLLVTLPTGDKAARKQRIEELKKAAKNVVVDTTNSPVALTLQCTAPSPTIAKELADEVGGYFSGPGASRMIPPWLPAAVAPALTAEQRLARRTYLRLQRNDPNEKPDPRISEITRQITEARKLGDSDEVTALYKRQRDIYEETNKRHRSDVRAGRFGPVDSAVIDLHEQLVGLNSQTNVPFSARSNLLHQIASRLGTLPDTVQPEIRWAVAQFGAAESKETTLHLRWMSFDDVATAAPTLVEWLCSKGCTEVRYSFGSELSFADLSDE